MEAPLVDAEYLLKKFPGKGGWTYADIPEILQDRHSPFGWVTVRGNIDGYELNAYKLMPMGNGRLFLPVKSAIRKKIGKEAGDFVHVVLYADEAPGEIPSDLAECFRNEPPEVEESFHNLPKMEKKHWLGTLYAARNDEMRAEKILELLKRLSHD